MDKQQGKMENKKHTPGPWTIHRPQAGHTGSSIYLGVGVEFAHVTGRDHAANARLIAAAPDLLAALEAAIPALIRLGDFVGNIDEGGASGMGRIDRCALIGTARAVIAKAKGE